MKLLAEALTLPTSNPYTDQAFVNSPHHYFAHSNPRAVGLHWLAIVYSHLIRQLSAVQLPPWKQVTLLSHILSNCSPRPSGESDPTMFQLIAAVVGGDTSSKDVTSALIEMVAHGRTDIMCFIIHRQSILTMHGCVFDPFFVDAADRTLGDVIADECYVWPLESRVSRAALDAVTITIREKHIPLLQTLLPLHGVVIDSELSPDELGSWSLQFIDCFGRPTALQQLLDQPASAVDAAAVVVTAQWE